MRRVRLLKCNVIRKYDESNTSSTLYSRAAFPSFIVRCAHGCLHKTPLKVQQAIALFAYNLLEYNVVRYN